MKKQVLETYKKLNTFFKDDFYFLNHGYGPAYPLFADELTKHQYSLYYHLIKNVKTDNLKILDIGCGRGGGTRMYRDYGFNFSEIYGCDLVPENVEFCKSTHKEINYQVADAINLPYEDNYFDVISSVESSHTYGGVLTFLREVKRVLKPSGVFLYTDVNPKIDDYLFNYRTDGFFFKHCYRDDITSNVAQALNEDLITWNSLEDSEFKDHLIEVSTTYAEAYSMRKVLYGSYVFYNDESKAILKI